MSAEFAEDEISSAAWAVCMEEIVILEGKGITPAKLLI